MLLVTGYEPFGDFETNPSGAVAGRLDGTEISGHSVHGAALPVDFERAGPELRSLIDELGPDVVVSNGLAAGRTAINVERVGINVDDSVNTPDNVDREPENQPIEPDGPAAYFSTLPVQETVSRLLDAGLPARLSNSAGTHLCNDVLYSTRAYVEANDLDIASGFVHLPLTPDEAITQADAPARGGSIDASMPIDMQIRALEIVLETAVEARD